MEKKNKKKMLWKIFISTLYLSAFTFGGGYVIVTLMKKKFVDDYHWIEENEMSRKKPTKALSMFESRQIFIVPLLSMPFKME